MFIVPRGWILMLKLWRSPDISSSATVSQELLDRIAMKFGHLCLVEKKLVIRPAKHQNVSMSLAPHRRGFWKQNLRPCGEKFWRNATRRHAAVANPITRRSDQLVNDTFVPAIYNLLQVSVMLLGTSNSIVANQGRRDTLQTYCELKSCCSQAWTQKPGAIRAE